MAFSLVNPFFGVYAIALGASSLMVGLLTAIPALVNTLVFMPAAGFVERRESRLPIVLFWAGLHGSLYLVLAFIPFMPLEKPALLVAVVTMMSIPGAISGVAWTAMMGYMFPAEDRGEIFGLRNMFVGVTGILGTMVAGRLLDGVSFPGNFTLLFILAAGFGGCGIALMSKMREPLLERSSHVQKRARLMPRIKSLLDDEELGSRFKAFCASSFLLWFGFGFLAAMWTIYHVEILKLSNTAIAVFNLVFAYSRPEKSPSATAVFNMLINLASFIAPILGDACYKMFGIRTTFYAGAGFRLFALIFLVRLVRVSDFTGRQGIHGFDLDKVGSGREERI